MSTPAGNVIAPMITPEYVADMFVSTDWKSINARERILFRVALSDLGVERELNEYGEVVVRNW